MMLMMMMMMMIVDVHQHIFLSASRHRPRLGYDVICRRHESTLYGNTLPTHLSSFGVGVNAAMIEAPMTSHGIT